MRLIGLQVGVNGKMLETETDEGELTTGNVVLELTGYPVIQLNYDQMNSTEVARYINVELRHGDQSATLRQEDRMVISIRIPVKESPSPLHELLI